MNRFPMNSIHTYDLATEKRVNRKVLNKFGLLKDDHLPINQKQKGLRLLSRISSEWMLTAVLQVYTILPFSVNQYKLATVQLDSRPRQTWHGRAGGQPNRLHKIL